MGLLKSTSKSSDRQYESNSHLWGLTFTFSWAFYHQWWPASISSCRHTTTLTIFMSWCLGGMMTSLWYNEVRQMGEQSAGGVETDPSCTPTLQFPTVSPHVLRNPIAFQMAFGSSFWALLMLSMNECEHLHRGKQTASCHPECPGRNSQKRALTPQNGSGWSFRKNGL